MDKILYLWKVLRAFRCVVLCLVHFVPGATVLPVQDQRATLADSNRDADSWQRRWAIALPSISRLLSLPSPRTGCLA